MGFTNDLADPRTSEAEERVYQHFLDSGWEILDMRDAHAKWDFVICKGDRQYRVDVKADRYMDKSGNVVFEQRHVYPQGHAVAGWGMCQNLDIVAMVGTETWRCAFLLLPPLRDFVSLGWGKPFQKWNDEGGYTTEGVLISLSDAFTCGSLFNLTRV